MLKIALAQINPCVGDLDANAQKIIYNIKRAEKEKADIVVFPELALTGYPPEDLLYKPHFIEQNLKYLNLIKEKCKIICILGFADKTDKEIYNACALIQNKKIKGIYHKVFLPNYGVFDEKRYFTGGDAFTFYDYEDYKFSISICEDIWINDFVSFLKDKRLDFVINISASPFHLKKINLRKEIFSKASKEMGTFLFYCNLVGGQDELVFDGTSMIFSPQGELIGTAKRFCEDFIVFTLDHKKKYISKKIPVKEEEETFSALKTGLYDYVNKNGFKKVIVGVSGGIDSALVIALAKITLGKDNVFGLIMPSQYNSQETYNDAKKICENLGIKYYIVRIDDVLKTYLNLLEPFFKNKGRDKTEENLQARIRGNILMAFSNKFGYLVLNTGNKSEVSCGYCTLYGDMVGGFGILKDLPKILVYKISNYINKLEGKQIIPISVIKRPPSAELKPNQKDTDTLPEYAILDAILKLYVEEDLSSDEIIKKGFEKRLVESVIKMVDMNEYKRRQSPIGIKITPRAFGRDRRMPITNKFSY